MANVFGAEGIRWMLEESRDLLLKVLLAVPACVPPLPGLEDSGAWLDPHDVEKLLDAPGVGALGEMMNMRGVTEGDDRMHAMISAAPRRGLVATGHWSLSGWNDHRLHAYAACGVDSCHEFVRGLGLTGCAIEQPRTMLAMLAVSAIPELRIGNRGLIDSRDYRLVPPVVG